MNYSIDKDKSFDENFDAFLEAVGNIDTEMAEILRANADALGEVVKNGERDSSARASFNARVVAALDELLEASESVEEEE